MSGVLLKSKGEEENDELGDLLNEEDVEELIRNNSKNRYGYGNKKHNDNNKALRLSLLEENINEERQGFLNSLLDFEIENEGDFGCELEDPFMFSRQKIMEDILNETEKKDNFF